METTKLTLEEYNRAISVGKASCYNYPSSIAIPCDTPANPTGTKSPAKA
jgi:hypothetical protein